jgi:hypothetical protein
LPLEWSDPRPPAKDICRYDHIVCETPLGEIRLEWKSWKEDSSPCGTMPWDEFVIGDDLPKAKAAAQAAWDAMVPRIAALATNGGQHGS